MIKKFIKLNWIFKRTRNLWAYQLQNDTLSHLKQPPSPQPNLKSNIVTGLLLLLGEKRGEKLL